MMSRVWHSRARSHSTHCAHTMLCICVELLETAVSAPFPGCDCFVYAAAVSGTTVSALSLLNAGVRYYALTAHAGV